MVSWVFHVTITCHVCRSLALRRRPVSCLSHIHVLLAAPTDRVRCSPWYIFDVSGIVLLIRRSYYGHILLNLLIFALRLRVECESFLLHYKLVGIAVDLLVA